jgi:hypothetical protein
MYTILDISWMEMSKVVVFLLIQTLQLTSLSKLIPTIFQHFDLQLTDPHAILREECK